MEEDETDDINDANELNWFNLVIAHSRIAKWADGIAAGKRSAVFDLRDAVQRRPAYAEEARRVGIVAALTRLLRRAALAEDEELLAAASSVITACSGPAACGGRLRTLTYGPLHVRIQEGALGDGLGARWDGHACGRGDDAVTGLRCQHAAGSACEGRAV
jgi:hypothetical protein